MNIMKTAWPLLLAVVCGCHAKEDGSVAFAKTPMMMSANLPAIDEAVPAKVETATFALG
jgi:hypothetical protein